jgi:hypothetical protein
MAHPDHATPHGSASVARTPGERPVVAPVVGGMAAASIGMGFFSMVVFWWNPFSTILAVVGLSLGLFTLARGVRGPRGENFAMTGVLICGTSIGITFTLNHVLRYIQWDTLTWF